MPAGSGKPVSQRNLQAELHRRQSDAACRCPGCDIDARKQRQAPCAFIPVESQAHLRRCKAAVRSRVGSPVRVDAADVVDAFAPATPGLQRGTALPARHAHCEIFVTHRAIYDGRVGRCVACEVLPTKIAEKFGRGGHFDRNKRSRCVVVLRMRAVRLRPVITGLQWLSRVGKTHGCRNAWQRRVWSGHASVARLRIVACASEVPRSSLRCCAAQVRRRTTSGTPPTVGTAARRWGGP